MADEGFKRKLAAIFSADAVGYSRLMGDDEEATIRTLTEYRETITTQVKRHKGRVVDSPGDNVLAEFASVVDAVRCAVETQKQIDERNSDLPENRRMLFRIGVNLGDIVDEGERIYGDGVNITARLESLADGGGICISGTAFDQVKGKLPLGYRFVGEQTVKNIPDPIRVYKVLMDERDAGKLIGVGKKAPKSRWAEIAAIVIFVAIGLVIYQFYMRSPAIEPASVEKMAYPLPDKPSIAVLPFDNLSGDPEQDYFSDGITEDIITNLSKISGLFVTARHSVFTYKGKTIKIAEVGKELGVRHVLEGSVRKANDRVRITAQLVDTTTEGHLWAERYDRDLKNIFALQDEVTQKIVAALAVKLTEDEQKRLVRKYTGNIESYDYYLRGLEYFNRFTKEANVQARQMHQKAIDMDPTFGAAYALLAWTYTQEWTNGWSHDPLVLELAFELAKRAIDLDESLPLGYSILGEVYLWKKQHEKAIAAQKKAISLSPNDADGIAGLGGILTWAGRPEEAIELVKKAMRLNPMYPLEYLWNLGHAYYLTRRYEEAIETFTRAIDRSPDWMPVHAYLAATYSELERMEEAHAEAAEFNRLSPQTSIEEFKHRVPYKDQAVSERAYNSWRKAGMK